MSSFDYETLEDEILSDLSNLSLYVPDYETLKKSRRTIRYLLDQGIKLPENLVNSIVVRGDSFMHHPNFPLTKNAKVKWESVNLNGDEFFFPLNTLSLLKYNLIPELTVDYMGEGSFEEDSTYVFSPLLFHPFEQTEELDIRPSNFGGYDIYHIPGRIRILPVSPLSLLIEQIDFVHWVTGYTSEGNEVKLFLPNVVPELLERVGKEDALIVFTQDDFYFFSSKANGPFVPNIPNMKIPYIDSAILLFGFNEWRLDKLSYLTYPDQSEEYQIFKSPVDLNLFLKHLKEGRIDLIENVLLDVGETHLMLYSTPKGWFT